MFMYTDVCTKNVKNTWKGARKTEEECVGARTRKEGEGEGGKGGQKVLFLMHFVLPQEFRTV